MRYYVWRLSRASLPTLAIKRSTADTRDDGLLLVREIDCFLSPHILVLGTGEPTELLTRRYKLTGSTPVTRAVISSKKFACTDPSRTAGCDEKLNFAVPLVK
jgi:hypothetical protein